METVDQTVDPTVPPSLTIEPRRHRLELRGATESPDFTGRVIPLHEKCVANIRVVSVGSARVRSIRAEPHRFEREKAFGATHSSRWATVVVGTGTLTGCFGDQQMDLRAGDAAVVDASTPGWYECREPASYLTIAVDFGAVRIPDRSELRLTHARLGRTRLVRTAVQQATALLAGRVPVAEAEATEARLRDLQSRVIAESRSGSTETDLRRRIECFIDANVGDPTFDRQVIATRFGLSLRQLHTTFDRGDETVGRAIRTRRVAALMAELERHPDTSSSELQRRFGFTGRDQMARAFRDQAGTTITGYREHVRTRPCGGTPRSGGSTL